MKKTLATLAICALAVGAYAQGKVTFGNANHPVTIVNDAALLFGAAKNSSLAGLAAPQTGSPNDVMGLLSAQLWAGTSAGNMTLQATIPNAGLAGLNDGIFRSIPVTLTGVPAGPMFSRYTSGKRAREATTKQLSLEWGIGTARQRSTLQLQVLSRGILSTILAGLQAQSR